MSSKALVRWSAASLLGDLVIGVGSVGTGSAVITDPRRNEPDNNWRGYSFYIYDGVNGASDSVNLLSNPGFETQNTGPTDPADWYLTAVGTASVIRSLAYPRTGVAHLDAQSALAGPAWVSQTVTVEPETEHKFSFWVKNSTSAVGSDARYNIQDSVGHFTVATTSVGVKGVTTEGSVYWKYETVFTTPADYTTLIVNLISPVLADTSVWIDDVSLTARRDVNNESWTITQSSSDDTSITLSEVSTYESATEKYELHALPKEDYDRAMNIAFQEIKNVALLPAVATGTMSDQEISVETDVASGWTHVYKVEIDRDRGWERLRPTKWTTLTGESILKIEYNIFSSYENYPIRLSGFKEPTEPDHDMKEYDLPREGHQYIIYRTASLLMPQNPDWFDSQQRAKLAGRWEQEATRLRKALTSILPANVRQL